MEKIAHAEIHLKQMGLTEYQVKAYLVLIRRGVLSAEEVSDIARIPLPRVYDTMDDLEKFGFVISVPTRPKKYKPVEIKEAVLSLLEKEKTEHEKRIENLKKTAADLSKLIKLPEQKPKSERATITTFSMRTNIGKIRRFLESEAKKEILILSYDASWLPEDLESLKAAIKRGVKIRMICTVNHDNKKIIRQAIVAGIKVKENSVGLVKGHIVDDEKAEIVYKLPLTEEKFGKVNTDETARYETVFIDGYIPLIQALKGYFESLWEKGKNVRI